MSARRVAAVMAVLLVLTVSTCSTSAGSRVTYRGTALSASGPATVGFFGFTRARVGKSYLFALPLLTNSSSSPVVITGYAMKSVSPAIRMSGYFAYSTRDVSGGSILYTAIVGERDAGVDVSALPNRIHQRRVLAPGHHDDLIVMVRTTLIRSRPGKLQGCTVRYRSRGIAYRQTFDCEYDLGERSP